MDKKYTATEWAMMEGGHTVPESSSKFSFVKDLNESSQYRTRQNVYGVSARELADHAFIDLMALWILYNEFDYAPISIKYAAKTMMYGGFRNYRQSGTDLYMTLHFITNKDADAIKGSGADNTLLQRINIPEARLKNYLNQMKYNQLSQGQARQFLQEMERKLYVTNSSYRSVRRLAQDWPKLNETQRALVVTRILQFYRTHARRSELFGFLSDLARSKKLEIRNANNAEQPKSKTTATIAKAAALGAAGYAGFQIGRSIGRKLV